MKRHYRHIHVLSIAVLMASSLLSFSAPGVSRNAVDAGSHLTFVRPEAELAERMEVAKAGGQIGWLLSHTRGQLC
jgi:hypothetical protein